MEGVVAESIIKKDPSTLHLDSRKHEGSQEPARAHPTYFEKCKIINLFFEKSSGSPAYGGFSVKYFLVFSIKKKTISLSWKKDALIASQL